MMAEMVLQLINTSHPASAHLLSARSAADSLLEENRGPHWVSKDDSSNRGTIKPRSKNVSIEDHLNLTISEPVYNSQPLIVGGLGAKYLNG